MAYEFKLTRRIDFVETDMAGIVHFSNFFRFMESAEAAFFRGLGLCIHPEVLGESVGWPRVHADCDYRRPLRFQDEVEIHLLVRQKKEKSIVYTFIFRKLNENPAQEVARGSLVTACVTRDKTSGQMMSVPIPREIGNLIDNAPAELLT